MLTRMFRGCFAAISAAVAIACAPSAALGSVNCPPDINNDSVVNVTDMLQVISAWGPCGASCAADIAPATRDNLVNVTDLLAVISGWGQCGSTSACGPDQGCLTGLSLWCENFELGNYSRWSGGYDSPSACETNGFSAERVRAGAKSQKSSVVCATSVSHRGYGGLRFAGDVVLPSFTLPSTGGIDAPNGVVVTMWRWIDAPYTFDANRWVSLLTCTSDCSNSWNNVITLNIDDSSMRLKPVHVSSVTYAPNAPAFPRGQWNRVTVYLNLYSKQMHVWQNGVKVCSASLNASAGTQMCQWHFGLYASGANDNITMYEDDYSMVKLTQPMTNTNVEPRFPTLPSPCGILP